jgi:hypothetical protein
MLGSTLGRGASVVTNYPPLSSLTAKQTRFSSSLISPRSGVAAPEFKSNALLPHLPFVRGNPISGKVESVGPGNHLTPD